MKLNKREKISIGIAAGALLATAVYLFIVTPLCQSYLDVKSEIVSRKKLVSHYQNLWEKRGAVEKKLATIERKIGNIHDLLLTEKSQSLAAAELQKMVEDLSGKTGVAISSSKVLGSRKVETFEEITIQVNVKSPLENMMNFLYQIENARKYLNIDEISLRILQSKDLENMEGKIKVCGYIEKI